MTTAPPITELFNDTELSKKFGNNAKNIIDNTTNIFNQKLKKLNESNASIQNNVFNPITVDNYKTNISRLNDDVIKTINKTKQTLISSENNNIDFMKTLINNLKYFGTRLDTYNKKITGIFELLKGLNNNNQGKDVENNNKNIQVLLEIINKYLTEFDNFNTLINTYNTNQIEMNNAVRKTAIETMNKVTDLYNLINTNFSNIGIFNLGDANTFKLYTYKQIHNKFSIQDIAAQKSNYQLVNTYFNNPTYNSTSYNNINAEIENNPPLKQQLNTLMNSSNPMPAVSGGKRTKNKRKMNKKTRKHLSKRRKAFLSRRA